MTINKKNTIIDRIFYSLLIIFFLFINNLNFLYSKQQTTSSPTTNNDILNSISSQLATSPECYTDLSDIIMYGVELAASIFAITTGKSAIISGNIKLASALIPVQIIGGIMVAGGIISVAAGYYGITDLVINANSHIACYLSFVRDPIMYYPDYLPPDHEDAPNAGKKKGFNIVNGKFVGFKPVNNYYEAAPAPNTDKITVCIRENVVPVGIFSHQGCYGKNQTGWISFKTSNKFSGQPDYDGPDSLFCPEEYRQIGRKPLDTKNIWDRKKLACTEYDGEKCPKGSLYVPHESAYDTLKFFKLTFGGPICKTAEFTNDYKKKEKINLGHSGVTVKVAGSKICATLTHGMFFMPLHKEWKLGCVNKKTYNVSPKCMNSIPIYENFKRDPITQEFISYGDANFKILSYDNSNCAITYNQCGISSLCKNLQGNKVFQAPIPITSYIYGCINDTSDYLFYGCGNNPSLSPSGKSGMLGVFQQRFKPIVFLILVLAIIMFAFKIIFIDSQIKAADFTVFIIKIAFVIYFTNLTSSSSSSHNGMKIYSDLIKKASTSLQAITMNAASNKSGICKYDDSKYDGPGQNDKGKYLHLKVWDILDCRLIYYLTSSFNPTDKLFDSNILQHVGAFLNYGISNIFIIFALIFITIFLFFWAWSIVQIIIVSGMLFSILILLSPLFVPLILFEPTKRMFDQWVSKIITFSLYPVMIFAFFGFSLLMIDRMTFGETEFVKAQDQISVMGRKVDYFKIDDSKNFSNPSQCNGMTVPAGCDCASTHCILGNISIGAKQTDSIIGETIGANVPDNPKLVKALHRNLFSLLFMLFILYNFVKKLDSFLLLLVGSSLALREFNPTSPHERMENLISDTGLFKYTSKEDDKPVPDINASLQNTAPINRPLPSSTTNPGAATPPIPPSNPGTTPPISTSFSKPDPDSKHSDSDSKHSDSDSKINSAISHYLKNQYDGDMPTEFDSDGFPKDPLIKAQAEKYLNENNLDKLMTGDFEKFIDGQDDVARERFLNNLKDHSRQDEIDEILGNKELTKENLEKRDEFLRSLLEDRYNDDNKSDDGDNDKSDDGDSNSDDAKNDNKSDDRDDNKSNDDDDDWLRHRF